MTSPFDVFRKPHDVRVFTASTLVKGVMTPGTVIKSTIKCSVQKIGRTQAEMITARGKRVSDFRRIYTDSKIPLSDEIVTGVAPGIPTESDLLETGTDLIVQIADGKGQPGEVFIDGNWYAVDERHPMQNGVINHYQYLLYRVNKNDQTV